MTRICIECRTEYPDKSFDKITDVCIGCIRELSTPHVKIAKRPMPEADSEWQEMSTVSRVNDLFMRQAKRK